MTTNHEPLPYDVLAEQLTDRDGYHLVRIIDVVSALEGLKEDMRIHFLTQYGAEDLRYKVDKWFPFLKDEKGSVRE